MSTTVGLIAMSLSSVTLAATAQLDLLTDNFGTETSFEMKLDQGDAESIDFSSPSPAGTDLNDGSADAGDLSNNTTYMFTWDLDPGVYEFTIFDAFGDGICCTFGLGEFTLTNGDEVIHVSSQNENPFTGASETIAFTVVDPVLEVLIDIKPGSDPNCFNINGHGVIPVAILGSADFDVTLINTGPNAVNPLVFNGLDVRVRGKKGPLCSIDDTNGDGHLDLVCHFEDDASQWVVGDDDEGVITGELFDGTLIEGTDSICIVPQQN